LLFASVIHSAADTTMAKQSTSSASTKSASKKHASSSSTAKHTDKRTALPVVTKSSKSSSTTAAPSTKRSSAARDQPRARLSSSETAQRYVLQVTGDGEIGSDGLVTNAAAPYGMGRSALERLGWRAGVSSVSTRAKGVLLAILTMFMDDAVLKAMMVARADGLRTIQSGHVALAAEAHGVSLQC
jgi:hypothetical protein